MTTTHTSDLSVAEARKVVSYAGAFLVVTGLLLIVAQVYWHDHFANMAKQLQGLGGQTVGLQTNVPGFGVMVVGAILLLATIVRMPKLTVGKD